MKKIFLLSLTSIPLLLWSVSCNFPSEAQRDAFYMTQTQEAIVQEAALAELQNESQNLLVQNVSDEEIILQGGDETNLETAANAEVASSVPVVDPNLPIPELPAMFQTDLLNPLDVPHTYEADTCQFLKNRWSDGKATPGTVVMVLMYHGIVRGDSVNQDNAITDNAHNKLMNDLHDQGFSAIDTEQFIGFITNNDYIPERSVLIIVDDRHSELNYANHFKKYYDAWGWKVVNAWISAEGTTQDLWDGNAKCEAEGYVDHQAHGVVHNINMGADSSDEFIYGELQGSIDQIQEHFGKTTRAIIWPGGGYAERPIEIAKELGYKVGFTTHPRGPVMYNWVPLCDQPDESRPYFQVDGNQDPLFVIPRYWDTDAWEHIDDVRQLGKAAKEYIYSNYDTEVAYYNQVCAATYGPLSTEG